MRTLDDERFGPSVDYLAWLDTQSGDESVPEPPAAPEPPVFPVGPRKKTAPDPRAKLLATARLPLWLAPPLRELREETPQGRVHRLRETEVPDGDA